MSDDIKTICDLCVRAGLPLRMIGRRDGEYWCKLEDGMHFLEGKYRSANTGDNVYNPNFRCTYEDAKR